MSDFPYSAINPDGEIVSILVTPDGVLVTDLSPLPTEVVPYNNASSIRVNINGEVLV